MLHADEINEIRQSVKLGPHQFELMLTFTEINWMRCSLLSEVISQKFLEILLIPAILKSFSVTHENSIYSVHPFISRRKDDTHWLYDYHLFVAKQADLEKPCSDQTVPRELIEVEEESVDEHCDDFDLTISSSLEEKIDRNFWSARLNFGSKFVDSYGVSSKVSRLQELCTTQNNIDFEADINQDKTNLEVLDSIAAVYEDIGPPQAHENEPTSPSHFTNYSPPSPPLNTVAPNVELVAGSAEHSIIDQTSNQDHDFNKNTDSQETICEESDNKEGDALVEDTEQFLQHGRQMNEHPQNIQNSLNGDGENTLNVGEESSQASTLYYDTAPSPDIDTYLSSSDVEFQSPVTSPVFMASQAYKDQLYHDIAGSLSFSLDPPSPSD